MPYNSMLRSVNSITDTSFYDQVVSNLISYFDWGLICIGGFFNVSRSLGSRGILTLSTDPKFPTGTVWESTRGNWVWETGLPYSLQPTEITGIYINGNFVINDNSIYKVDYLNGRIIFIAAQPTNTTVVLDYAYKMYSFYDADTNWFRQVIFDNIDESAMYELLAVNRVYLPAVIVEYVPKGELIPYQIGDGMDRHQDQDILFHILSDSYAARNKMVDIIQKQFDATIYLYNLDLIAEANAFALNPDGFLNGVPKQYPALVVDYFWATGTFEKARSEEVARELGLFRATVRITMRIDQF